jgi:hypothetical protein
VLVKKYETDVKNMPKEELKSSVKSIEVSFHSPLYRVRCHGNVELFHACIFNIVCLFVTMQNLLDEFTQWEKKVDDILTDIAANNSQEAPEDFANVQELVQVLLTAAAQGKNAILVSSINDFHIMKCYRVGDRQLYNFFHFI